jgi:GTP pyrophosphokinase
MIEVDWDFAPNDMYKVTVEVTGSDRPGLLSDIMMVASESKTNINSVNAKVNKNKVATITISIDIKNLTQLEYIMTKMRRVKDIFNVHRVTQGTGGF